jgi:undecaprenyl-diphosphatase
MNSIIIFSAKYLFLSVIFILGFVWLRANRTNKIRLTVATIIAGILAYGLMKVAGSLFYDPRPFVTHHIKPLVSHGADNGFPSEHTVFTMTLSSIIYLYSRHLGAIALAITLVVGVSRVLAHVHSPVDIAAGVVIGAVAGMAGYYAAGKLISGQKKKTTN